MLELGVGTGKWDAGLKKAKQSLDNFTQANGGLQQALEKESQKMQKFVQMMGQMNSTAKTAKGQMNDYKATIEQLTMQYNRMSEAQKKTIGQDYLNSIDQIKEKFRQAKAEMEGINKSLGDMKMPDMKGGGFLSGIGDKMSGALQVFGGNLMTKGAGMLAGLASEMGDMVKQGVELAKQGEGIRIAFERLGRGDILDGLRQATHGTVTDIELMKAAVKFNDFKLPLDELGTMLAFAQQKAKDTGQSVDYMVDSIVTGLGRKSLMILDNLGLSATEVKDKMKETGDMTKAVGAIIREQMAKAGDYVETAADRAAQANVSLQNKMEELGRKFAPLEEASNSLWTSMKIGIMDVIGGPLTDLLNKLTAAGRMMNAYGKMGGSGKVGRMTANLAGTSEQNRQSLYQQQQQQFLKYINPREQQIRDIRAWQSGQRGEALQGRIGAIRDKYGSLDATKIQAEVDAAKKMLADYQAAAKQILQPIKQEITPTITTSGGATGGKGATKTPQTELQQNQTKINELTQQYVTLMAAASKAGKPLTDEQQKQTSEIQRQIAELEKRNGQLKLFDERAHGRLLPVDTSRVTEVAKDGITGNPFLADNQAMEFTGSLKLQLDEKAMDAVDKQIKKQTKGMKGGWEDAAGAIQAVGSAMSQIEDPAAKVVGTVAQAIASIALGYAQATIKAQETGGPWAWIAFAAAGLATMISTISAIHSATGYAQGGMIKGNSYSGDNIGGMVDGGAGGFVGLNAGEVVLNRAQTGNLASQLQGSGFGNARLVGRLKGRDILISIDRELSATGKGQLATWK